MQNSEKTYNTRNNHENSLYRKGGSHYCTDDKYIIIPQNVIVNGEEPKDTLTSGKNPHCLILTRILTPINQNTNALWHRIKKDVISDMQDIFPLCGFYALQLLPIL